MCVNDPFAWAALVAVRSVWKTEYTHLFVSSRQADGHEGRIMLLARLSVLTIVWCKNTIILCKDISFSFYFWCLCVTHWFSMLCQNGPNDVAKRPIWECETDRLRTRNGLFCKAKWHVWEWCKINSELKVGKDDMTCATLQHRCEDLLIMHNA